MKIIKSGTEDLYKKTKKFRCKNCTCVFEADESEYETDDWYNLNEFVNETYFSAECPWCGNTIMKQVIFPQ